MANWKKTMMASAGAGGSWIIQMDNETSQTSFAYQFISLTPASLEVLSDGSIAVLGYSRSSSTYRQYIFKFDADGNLLTRKRLGDTATGSTSSLDLGWMFATSDDELYCYNYYYTSADASTQGYVMKIAEDLSTVENLYKMQSVGWYRNGFNYLPSSEYFTSPYSNYFITQGITGSAPATAYARYTNAPNSASQVGSFHDNAYATTNQSYFVETATGNPKYFVFRKGSGGILQDATAWSKSVYWGSDEIKGDGIITSPYRQGSSTSGSYDLYFGGSGKLSTKGYITPILIVLDESTGNTNAFRYVYYYTGTNSSTQGLGVDSSGNIFINEYRSGFNNEFVIHKFDSSFNHEKSLRFSRTGASSSQDFYLGDDSLGKWSTIRFSPEEDFMYINGAGPFMSGTYASAGSFVMKLPTDMSLTGTFDFPATSLPFTDPASAPQFVITDVTSSTSSGTFTKSVSSTSWTTSTLNNFSQLLRSFTPVSDTNSDSLTTYTGSL